MTAIFPGGFPPSSLHFSKFKLELNSHGACIHANPYYEPNMLNPNTRLFIIIIPFAKPYAGGVSRSLWRPAAACSRSTSVGFYSAHTNTLVSSSTCFASCLLLLPRCDRLPTSASTNARQ